MATTTTVIIVPVNILIDEIVFFQGTELNCIQKDITVNHSLNI